VVLPFQLAQGLDEKSGKILDEVFLSELTPLIPQGVQVVGSSDVTAVLGFEQQKMLVGCDESSCLMEIGNALGASHIVVPSLGKFGEQFIVTTKVIDVKDGRVLHRKVQYVDGTEAGALTGVRQSVLDLAVALGWTQASSNPLATTTPASTPTATSSPPVEARNPEPGAGPSPLLIAGGALAGVGALAALGLGIGAVALDGQVASAGNRWDERETAAYATLGLAAGSGVGLLALVAGGVLVGVSLVGE
ncbi:MAG: hypothetical protein ABIJ09_09430, partial [Pseudomonadota bacterium]